MHEDLPTGCPCKQYTASMMNEEEAQLPQTKVKEATTKKILSCGKFPPCDFVKGSKATFHFKVSYHQEDGDQITLDDSQITKIPFELLLGKQFKMPVIEEFIKTMRVGEVARFTAIPALCTQYPFVAKQYRSYVKSLDKDNEDHKPVKTSCCGVALQQGTGHADLDVLLSNPQELEFVIELLSVEMPNEYEQEIWQMTDEEKILKIPVLKEEGNRFYKLGRVEEAYNIYAKGYTIIDQIQSKEKPGESEWEAYQEMKIPFLSNMSLCKLNMKDYYRVIELSSQVIDADKTNVKSFFRRAKAHIEVWNFKEAVDDLNRVKELEPKMDGVVQKELSRIESLSREKKEQEKKLFTGKLFSS